MGECMKYILHGGNDKQTECAMRILDEAKIPYRLELAPEENYGGQVELVCPMGRVDLEYIENIFGKTDLEAQTKTA